jgi:flavodoxin
MAKKSIKKPIKKAVKKTAKKPVKKTVKKPVKKVIKKAVKKPVKKVIKKAVKKPVKKVANKAVKRPAQKKTVKKKLSKPSRKPSKKLVVFYSLTGCVKLLAESLAKEIKADVLELKYKNEMNLKGFFKYFILGGQSAFGLKPALKKLDKDPSRYDVLFLGTPVWASTYASPFNSFISQGKIKNKKIALFCSYGGSKGNVFNHLRNKLVDNEIIGEIEFKDFYYHKVSPKDSKDNIAKWGNRLLKEV